MNADGPRLYVVRAYEPRGVRLGSRRRRHGPGRVLHRGDAYIHVIREHLFGRSYWVESQFVRDRLAASRLDLVEARYWCGRLKNGKVEVVA